MTPTELENRLTAALAARAGQVTAADLRPPAPPTGVGRPGYHRWMLAGVALAAVVLSIAIFVVIGQVREKPLQPGRQPEPAASTQPATPVPAVTQTPRTEATPQGPVPPPAPTEGPVPGDSGETAPAGPQPQRSVATSVPAESAGTGVLDSDARPSATDARPSATGAPATAATPRPPLLSVKP